MFHADDLSVTLNLTSLLVNMCSLSTCYDDDIQGRQVVEIDISGQGKLGLKNYRSSKYR